MMFASFKMATRMLSTEILHSNPNKSSFVGKYISCRKLMDYNYFENYTHERQLIQDGILDKIFANKPILKKPWSIYTSGCYGSGKSHVLNHLTKQNILDINLFAMIDPDAISYQLPEMEQFIAANSLLAGNLIHKESVYISMLAEYNAYLNNYAIIIDGSLHNHKWYSKHFETIRESFPHYTLGIIKVDASLDTIKQRCERRGKITGRIIDMELIEDVYNKIPQAFDVLSKYVELTICVTNEETVKITDFKIKML